MSSSDKKKGNLKKKIFHEITEYWINFFYLVLIFGAFTWYRRFILAAYDITYTNYWIAVIKAAVLAKVILIGDIFHLGHRLEQKPLIYSTLLKTVVFSVFVWVFTLIEHVIKGLVQGQGPTGGLVEFFGKGSHELLAECLVIFVAFIPFFAFRELGRVLGEGKIWKLFFRSRETSESIELVVSAAKKNMV